MWWLSLLNYWKQFTKWTNVYLFRIILIYIHINEPILVMGDCYLKKCMHGNSAQWEHFKINIKNGSKINRTNLKYRIRQKPTMFDSTPGRESEAQNNDKSALKSIVRVKYVGINQTSCDAVCQCLRSVAIPSLQNITGYVCVSADWYVKLRSLIITISIVIISTVIISIASLNVVVIISIAIIVIGVIIVIVNIIIVIIILIIIIINHHHCYFYLNFMLWKIHRYIKVS